MTSTRRSSGHRGAHARRTSHGSTTRRHRRWPEQTGCRSRRSSGRVLVDEHADVLRESVKWLAGQLMEIEVCELIGVERGERTEDRVTHRNGYRPRRWDTRAGEIELQIPKIRQGSYFPSFLQPRKRSEQALLSVVQQAYVCGVSTRRVDQLVESLGLRVSRSEVSRICGGLDEQVQAFRTRPLEAATSICSSTPRSRRSVTAAGCSASAWSSPTASTIQGGGRSSVSTSARRRPRRSGLTSSGAWWRVAWSACNWSSPTRTRG
jgi:hypothetical protein